VSLGTSGLVQLLGIVTGVALARGLGAHDRGVLAAAFIWPTLLAGIGSLGMADSTTFVAAREPDTARALAGTSLAIGAAQSVALVALGAAFVPLLAVAGVAEGSAFLALAIVPLYLLTLYLMNLLNGLQRTTAFQVLRATVLFVAAALLVALALTGTLTVATAVGAQLAAHGITGAIALALVLRRTGGRLAFDRRVARRLLSFGARSHLNTVSGILNERLDQLLISLLMSPVALGLYVIAVTLTTLTTSVAGSFALVALPSVAGLPPGAERTAAARRCIALAAVGSAAVTVPLLVLAPRLIDLFFGHSFAGAVDVCRVLLVAAVLLGTSRSVAAVLTALGRPLDAGVPELAGALLTIPALAILLPRMGLMGAGVASLAAYALTLACVLRRASRALDVPVAALLLPTRRPALAPAAEAR
jgi:antigen flippase